MKQLPKRPDGVWAPPTSMHISTCFFMEVECPNCGHQVYGCRDKIICHPCKTYWKQESIREYAEDETEYDVE